jgi:hypothetical protein
MWQLGGHRIYVQKFSKSTSSILPRLQPLSGGTVIQSFGYDSTTLSITAIVVGDTINNILLGYAQDGGVLHALVSPEGGLGSWMVKSCSPNRTNSTCQSIDISQPETAPVYEVELELWKED